MDLQLVKKERKKKYDKKGERKILRLKLSVNLCNTVEIFVQFVQRERGISRGILRKFSEEEFQFGSIHRCFSNCYSIIISLFRSFLPPRSTPRKSINLSAFANTLSNYIYIYIHVYV